MHRRSRDVAMNESTHLFAESTIHRLLEVRAQREDAAVFALSKTKRKTNEISLIQSLIHDCDMNLADNQPATRHLHVSPAAAQNNSQYAGQSGASITTFQLIILELLYEHNQISA